MTTLEKINLDGIEAIEAIGRGDILNAYQKQSLKIYNQLHSGKAGNSGKRKIIKTGK